MFTLLGLLRSALVVFAASFATIWATYLTRRGEWKWPSFYMQAVGFVTNFFDTLGIGSYATTTAAYRLRNTIADEMLPGTLNIGHCLPIAVQAFIYMEIVKVDEWTLVSMIAASVLGAWLGAKGVVRLSQRMIRGGLGIALLVAAIFLLSVLLQYGPPGGEALSLHGAKLAIGLVASFVFGSLMMIGVGAYAPIMITVSLLGMDPKAAFPIMMGSCAFLTPIGSLPFLQKNKYDSRAALGLTLGGIPAVFIAAYLVQKLPLDVVRWMVVLIAIHASVGLLRAAYRNKRPSTEA